MENKGMDRKGLHKGRVFGVDDAAGNAWEAHLPAGSKSSSPAATLNDVRHAMRIDYLDGGNLLK